MGNFAVWKASKIIKYLRIKPKIPFNTALTRSLSISTISTPHIKTYDRIHDYNFDFFHRNPAYSKSFLQVDATQFQQMPVMMEDMESKLGCLSDERRVNSMSHDEVIKMMELISSVKFRNNQKRFNLKFIDEKCSSAIHSWSLEKSLYVFDAWFLILQQKAFHTRYFFNAVNLWSKYTYGFTKNNLIQLLYYLAFCKKSPYRTIGKLLKKIEEKQREMNDIEMAIVCLCCFKLRIKAMPVITILRTVEVAQNLILQNERFHLISILKFLRQLRVYDNELASLLQNYILKEINSFNFVECTHFLATFSAESVCNESVFQVLEKQGILMLGSEEQYDTRIGESRFQAHPSTRSRVKDLSRFLWAMVNIGYQPNSMTIETILNTVRKKYNDGEYEQRLYCFVDCLHSFAMMNIYPDDLVKIAFKESFLSSLQEERRAKPLYQMYFLYKSVDIESPEMVKSIGKEHLHSLKPVTKDLDTQIQEHKDLAYILSLIQQLDVPGARIDHVSILPHIVIPGIVIDGSSVKNDSICEKKNIYVEVLDSSMCCRNGQYPSGLMSAKLRQLKRLGNKVIVITQDDISLIKSVSHPHQSSKLRELLFS